MEALSVIREDKWFEVKEVALSILLYWILSFFRIFIRGFLAQHKGPLDLYYEQVVESLQRKIGK